MTVNDPLPTLGLAHFLTQANPLALAVLGLLLILSVASWYQILAKTWQGLRRYRRSQAFLARLRDLPEGAPTAAALAAAAPTEPFARLALTGLRARARALPAPGQSVPEAPIVRALALGIAHEGTRLESGLTLLASVAATAPFIGLFGTVGGIYQALLGLGQPGHGSLEQVAGPVGEALIMTGLGLAVAIPAVLAYNAFNRANRVLIDRLEGFAQDLLSVLVTDRRDGEAPATLADSGEARP
ncbi:hypothetical protein THSYN_12920 [Candidatus Thiodictyon syntrophicum]|jgi:biopolymer transport protein ExbB|uniref:Biopolymer transport protein ExbB n=1 Tax=Candidatus Thiodictyon syntrophicum TaxID=1166950 RepID=A0A2K8U8A3_9GAMM|nr:hypothetical protein THSYN_12920 [Candidatus Thiodictyon syntrophicum]